MTQLDLDDDDDSGGEQPLYIKEEDDEEEPIKEEEASMDSTDGNDTRLSDLHNTTLKTEDDSEEDKPLVDTSLLVTNVIYKYYVLYYFIDCFYWLIYCCNSIEHTCNIVCEV